MQAVVESKIHYPLARIAEKRIVIGQTRMFHMKQLNYHFL